MEFKTEIDRTSRLAWIESSREAAAFSQRPYCPMRLFKDTQHPSYPVTKLTLKSCPSLYHL